jgi:hypothetical protein
LANNSIQLLFNLVLCARGIFHDDGFAAGGKRLAFARSERTEWLRKSGERLFGREVLASCLDEW